MIKQMGAAMSQAMLLNKALPATDHRVLTRANGERSRFHYLWLRDNCQQVYLELDNLVSVHRITAAREVGERS